MKRIYAIWGGLILLALLTISIYPVWSESPGEGELDIAASELSAAETLDSATPATANIRPSTTWVETCRPPLLFSTGRVAQARDRARRVGWTEAVIDAQANPAPGAGEKAWSSCLKAALFGEIQRAQNAATTLAEALKAAPAKDDPSAVRGLMLALQSYDCLVALPEWEKIEPSIRDSLKEALNGYVTPIFDRETAVSETPLRTVSLRLYAGLLTGATAAALAALEGEEGNPGLDKLAITEILPEGIVRDYSLQKQVNDGEAFFMACAALRSGAPETSRRLEPAAKAMMELVRDLIYPTGHFPSVVRERPPVEHLIRFLERGVDLFGDPHAIEILNALYKIHPRRAESLLFADIPDAKEKTPAAIVRALPQTGVAILHDATADLPLSMYLDTGLSGENRSSALLAIEWNASRREAVETLDDIRTDHFNTLIIDRAIQPAAPSHEDEARNAFLYSCKAFEDGAAYVRAVAQGEFTERAAYPAETVSTPVPTYERTLFLSSPFAADLFRARGGRVHDWIYHSPTGLSQLINGEWSVYSPTPEDYPWMKDSPEPLQAATLKDYYGFLFAPLPGTKRHHRIWVIDPAGTQWIWSKNGGGAALVGRRAMVEDEGDLFTVVHEWFEGDAAPDVKVERLRLDPGANQRDFQSVAFVWSQGEDEHMILSSMNPDVSHQGQYNNGQIVFQGAFGHIHLRQGKVERMRLVGGSTLRYGAYGVQTNAALNFGVARGVNPASGILEAEFSNHLPGGPTMQGDVLMALSPRIAPVMYRPLVVDGVTQYGPPQSFLTRYRLDAKALRPSLGEPVTTGDQLIYENGVELSKIKDDLFAVEYSAPAGVLIEGATDRHRIFFSRSELIRKVRGDFSANTIQFHLEPHESVDGRVEFYRIP